MYSLDEVRTVLARDESNVDHERNPESLAYSDIPAVVDDGLGNLKSAENPLLTISTITRPAYLGIFRERQQGH